MGIFDKFKKKEEPERKLSREELIAMLKDAKENPVVIEKYKIPGPQKAAEKSSLKKKDMVLVEYLDMQKRSRTFLTKLYGGNFVVIEDHVYRYKPSKMWKAGKYNKVIIKAWDREMVGTEDYDDVVNKGNERCPINDPVLIKALIQAKLGEQKKAGNSVIIWIILGVIGIAAGYMIFFAKR